MALVVVAARFIHLCVEYDYDPLCSGLWKAKHHQNTFIGERVAATKEMTNIHIVVSHCKSDLQWVSQFTKGYKIASFHVISKCGDDVKGAPRTAVVVELPNVGRCDHSYVYYINNILDEVVANDSKQDSIVFFLKDDMSPENFHQL